MDKISMREWVASLQGMVDNKLRKWKQGGKIENGASVHIHWQYEGVFIHLYVYWQDGQETVKLNYVSAYDDRGGLWHGLNDKTFNIVLARMADLEHLTMFPPYRLYGLNG